MKANVEPVLKQSRELKDQLTKKSDCEITPLRALELFKKMKKDEVAILMLDSEHQSPVDLLVEYIIVPPLSIRPTVKVGGDKTNEDDMTVKVYEILKQNSFLGHCLKEGRDMYKINEIWALLQGIYTQYVNSETSGLPKELVTKSSTKGIVQRLKGKTGRFRGNLSGKRVEYSARTVITPDPNLRIDQVGVPRQMALVLTYGEKVNARNIKRLRLAVKNGPNVYPGANYISLKGDPTPLSLAFHRNKKLMDTISIGDTVHRHLVDDDIILFNRQPSLHKLSIMGFRAKVVDHRTLRFNECACTPFNADFDGDEMNIHLPQTEEARAEVIQLMGSVENIVNPKNGSTIISLTQDFLTCSFLLSNKDTFFSRSEFCSICSYFCDANEPIELPVPTIIKPVELWTGKQVIGMLLVPHKGVKPIVNIEVQERNYNKKENKQHFDLADGYVCFRDSELISGTIGKATLGDSKSGLFYCLLKDNSKALSAMCMQRFAKLSARWLTNYGMTLSLGDVTPEASLIAFKKKLIQDHFDQCTDLIRKYERKELRIKPGCTAESTLEDEVSAHLSKIRDEAGSYCFNHLPFTNSALKMAICGSKGSNLNLCQMIACVGQQIVSGKRVSNGFTFRTLPHFEENCKEPKARGFVQNSFYDGLTPNEFFFHTMAGREGLIDTAVKTADTGYMQRRLIKAMEDIVVDYDATVRNSEGSIIQFTYGDDGLDPIHCEDSADFPIDLDRLLKYARSFYPRANNQHGLLPPQIKHLSQSYLSALQKDPDAFIVPRYVDHLKNYFENYANNLIKLFGDVKSPYSPSMGLTDRQLDFFFKKLRLKLLRARIQAGEAVGATTAQSIGEPCTQMTLKTFHFAGVASMNVTLGVPRIKEIINASTNIQTPIIEIFLKNPSDLLLAKLVKNKVHPIYIQNVAEYIREVYEPQGCHLELKLDLPLIKAKLLDVTVEKVVEAILSAKLKLKPKHVKILSPSRIQIDSYDSSERELIFILKHLKNKIRTIKCGGIGHVKRALISYNQDDKDKEYRVFAEGLGLDEVMSLPQVNHTKTKTNHIIEILHTLGVEAARTSIIDQIKYTIGIYAIKVDIRHINILADAMTHKGRILGITRYGIAKMRDSTLMLASFEKTADILFDAAYFGKVDRVLGVSEKIILGDQMSLGTGYFNLFYDAPTHNSGQPVADSILD
jgi:DNA-directed RNA polymerase III subunit RPC1